LLKKYLTTKKECIKMSESTDVSDIKPIDGIGGEKKDVVDYETFNKLLGQRKADQIKLKELDEKLKSFEAKETELQAKERELEEKKALSDGNWKAILESREAQLKRLEAEKAVLQESVGAYEKKFTDALKINAFQEALGGKLKKSDYYNFVDTSKIAIDPETGSIDDKSLKDYATKFATDFKELIAFKGGTLPSDAPSPKGKLTYEEWLRLPVKEQRLRQNDVK
jgi:hypothetical protein